MVRNGMSLLRFSVTFKERLCYLRKVFHQLHSSNLLHLKPKKAVLSEGGWMSATDGILYADNTDVP